MKENQPFTDKASVHNNLYAGIAEKLQTEVKNSPAFKAIAELFTKRERARSRLTLNALTATMIRTGHKFSREECKAVLLFIARIGCAVGDYDARSSLRGIKSIRFTLQSIGLVALGRSQLLEPFGVRSSAAPAPTPQTVAETIGTNRNSVGIRLQVTLDDSNHVSFELPNKITPTELITLLSKFFTF